MLITGKTVKEEDILSNTIYVIRQKREINFWEPQSDGDGDTIIIFYDLLQQQYGVFAKEYRPGFVDKTQCKKADILMLVIDEAAKKYSSWIFDVKVSVGGEDVIFNLLEQLCDSFMHKNSITAYLQDFEESEHIGFITRDFQAPRINHAISIREKYIVEEKEKLKSVPSSIKYSIQTKILKMSKEVQVLKTFLAGYIEINNNMHAIEYYSSVREGTNNVCRMRVFV